MTKFKLPKGYSFAPPDDDTQDILIGGQKLYGGADPSDAWDADGTHWTFCNATGPDGKFRFRAFAQPAGVASYSERPIPDSVDGRGNADVQWYDGKAHYTCWQKDQFYQNAVPNFKAFPSIPSLAARIAALEAGGGVKVPVEIPADGAIDVLYSGAYAPTDLDTPQEVALRVSKQLAALNELVGLLKAAGVLA